MRVNGKDVELLGNENISKLLNNLGVNVEKVVVEVDGDIIPKESFEEFILKDTCSIEVVSFVGGGW